MRTVKVMIDGVWQGDVPDKAEIAALRAAGRTAFRGWVAADGSSGFPAEPERYHLYVSYACPWAHRTILYRQLKRLEGIVGMSVLQPRLGTPDGWRFAESAESEDATIDHVGGHRFLHEVYAAAKPDYTGKVTVPVLWDRKTHTIVSKESGDIIRMLNAEFDEVGGSPSVDFYPDSLRSEIDALNAWLLPDVCAGVYAAGFAATQEGHNAAVMALFAGLDRLEAMLADGRPFLLGDQASEPDWHLFCTAVRFDIAYHGRLLCSLRRYADYPNLSAHLHRLRAYPGVADTVRLQQIKHHYYDQIGEIDPRIVPLGPPVDFLPNVFVGRNMAPPAPSPENLGAEHATKLAPPATAIVK
jgi:putative glutathione S-transferase